MRAITGMMWISALLYSPKFLVATLSPEREIVPEIHENTRAGK